MVVRQFGLQWRWTARILSVEPGHGFVDEQDGGPFAEWRHTHRFRDAPDGAVLEDDITYRLPLGALGQIVAGRAIARIIDRGFTFRHQRTREDLMQHARAALPPQRIAITGASGLVGSALVAFLRGGGHTVTPLTRRTDPPEGWATFDPANGSIDRSALEGLDAVIHLAGESISQKWDDETKKRIQDSRIKGTRALSEVLASLDAPPKVLVSGSAVGFYGLRGQEQVDEDSAPGTGFLAETCVAWEQATATAETAGIRVVHLRTGIVLTPEGGALGEQLTPYKLGMGGPVGSGEQWISWITRDDLLGLILHALATEDLKGPLNGTAPNPVQQRTFAKTLGRVLGRPAIVPLPAFAVRLMFGEMGQNLLLHGQRVHPGRALETGYTFLHPELEPALRFLLGRQIEETA